MTRKRIAEKVAGRAARQQDRWTIDDYRTLAGCDGSITAFAAAAGEMGRTYLGVHRAWGKMEASGVTPADVLRFFHRGRIAPLRSVAAQMEAIAAWKAEGEREDRLWAVVNDRWGVLGIRDYDHMRERYPDTDFDAMNVDQTLDFLELQIGGQPVQAELPMDAPAPIIEALEQLVGVLGQRLHALEDRVIALVSQASQIETFLYNVGENQVALHRKLDAAIAGLHLLRGVPAQLADMRAEQSATGNLLLRHNQASEDGYKAILGQITGMRQELAAVGTLDVAKLRDTLMQHQREERAHSEAAAETMQYLARGIGRLVKVAEPDEAPQFVDARRPRNPPGTATATIGDAVKNGGTG